MVVFDCLINRLNKETLPTQLTNQIIRKLLSDMAKEAEVGNGTSSTTRSAKNSSASVDMVEYAEVGEGDGSNDETVKRSPFKKSSGSIGYLTSLHFEKMSSPDNLNHC